MEGWNLALVGNWLSGVGVGVGVGVDLVLVAGGRSSPTHQANMACARPVIPHTAPPMSVSAPNVGQPAHGSSLLASGR